MINGVVSSDREATTHLTVLAPAGAAAEVTLLIDTGFNGWISLPPALISQLDLPWRRRGRGELADGSETIFDIYEAFVIWEGQKRRAWVDEMDAAPLLGMSLLDGHRLTVEVWESGNVTITAR